MFLQFSERGANFKRPAPRLASVGKAVFSGDPFRERVEPKVERFGLETVGGGEEFVERSRRFVDRFRSRRNRFNRRVCAFRFRLVDKARRRPNPTGVLVNSLDAQAQTAPNFARTPLKTRPFRFVVQGALRFRLADQRRSGPPIEPAEPQNDGGGQSVDEVGVKCRLPNALDDFGSQRRDARVGEIDAAPNVVGRRRDGAVPVRATAQIRFPLPLVATGSPNFVATKNFRLVVCFIINIINIIFL